MCGAIAESTVKQKGQRLAGLLASADDAAARSSPANPAPLPRSRIGR
jgi:hypothetical protein